MKDRLKRNADLARLSKMLIAWSWLSLRLHLVWEIGQLPLYTLWHEEPVWYIAWAVLHCTVGDGMIAAGSFVVAVFSTGRVDWPWRSVRSGAFAMLASGIGYSAFSELRNVSNGAWAYTDQMPTLLGVGVSPLLQWLVVPALALVLLRRNPPPETAPAV